MSDGAGAAIVQKTENKKQYESNIISKGQKGNLLTNKTNEKIKMNGKEIYKYAVTETVANIKIMNSIANRLDIDSKKVYVNIEKVGNTFCASIPIAIDEMFEKGLLEKGDKIVLLGYGGGLNTGSILMEV